MNFLTLNQQLAGKIEAAEGVAEALAAANVQLRPFQDFNFEPQLQRFTNDEVADDIGVAPDFVNGQAGGIGFGVILATGGTVGTPPALSPYMQACGHKEQIVRQVAIGSITGGDTAFKAGETFTATGGKAGIIEKDISSSGTLRYILTSGTALTTSDVITAGSDSSTATCSGTSSMYAIKYTPTSTNQAAATIQRGEKIETAEAGQDYLYRLRGARGTGGIELNALDAVRARFSFTGVWDFTGAGSFFTGVTYEPNIAGPKLVNATIQLNGVLVNPAAINLDYGVTVEMDPDPSTDGGLAGYKAARIARREPVITIDPKRLKPSVLDDLGTLKSGATIPISIICGTTPQILEIAVPKAQLRGWSPGNRAGRSTAALQFTLTRDSLTDNEYALYFR